MPANCTWHCTYNGVLLSITFSAHFSSTQKYQLINLFRDLGILKIECLHDLISWSLRKLDKDLDYNDVSYSEFN